MARILVVDDEATLTTMLRLLLETEGHTVRTTERGQVAAEWLRTTDEAIDLMITDMRMSPLTGMDLLRLAREVRPAMPVILLTAYASRETAEEARQLGAFAYLPKPFQMPKLLAAVNEALAKAGG
jgi:DNA-binding NtrC family response regulator